MIFLLCLYSFLSHTDKKFTERPHTIQASFLSYICCLVRDFLEKEMGNPLQCSCLENSRDRGDLWAAVYGVAQSQTRLM